MHIHIYIYLCPASMARRLKRSIIILIIIIRGGEEELESLHTSSIKWIREKGQVCMTICRAVSRPGKNEIHTTEPRYPKDGGGGRGRYV